VSVSGLNKNDMKRHWLIVHISSENDDTVEETDVVPGIWVDNEPICHGHILGSDCDCRPQILPNLENVIIVHRADI
jgi:hypothetical protein